VTTKRKARPWSEVDPEIEANEKEVQRLTRQYRAASRKALLEDLRKEKGLTQVSLAEILGVDQSRISRIEGGALDSLELRTIQEYAEALGGKVEIAIKIGKERITLVEPDLPSLKKRKSVRARARTRSISAKRPTKSH
jgi:transcriptional regulator with XRE-family HTH domain